MMNGMPYPYMPNMMMPEQPGTGIEQIRELQERVQRLERQVKRLENKVYQTENLKMTDYTTAPPKDNGMYMM